MPKVLCPHKRAQQQQQQQQLVNAPDSYVYRDIVILLVLFSSFLPHSNFSMRKHFWWTSFFFAFACLLLPFFRMSLYHSLNCQLKMREPNVCDTFFCCGYNFIRISIFENTCVHLNYSTIRVIIANWIRKCKSHPFIEERKRMKEKSKTSLRLFNSGPTLCVCLKQKELTNDANLSRKNQQKLKTMQMNEPTRKWKEKKTPICDTNRSKRNTNFEQKALNEIAHELLKSSLCI